MTKTNWNHSSKLLLAALVVLAAFVVPAGAVSVSDTSVPSEGEAGTQVSATVTLNELYQNPQYEQWQLAGSTQLTDVTWTVTFYDQTGAKVSQQSFDGQNFSGATVSAEEGVSEVDVKVSGTVPDVENFTYDPAQTFRMMELRQERSGGTSNVVDSWQVHHFTEDSDAARDQLDSARQAVESAGNPQDASETFSSAVDAFNSGNFDNAETLADRATREANQAEQSQQTTQLLIYAGVGLVVVLALVGGFLYWRSQQDSYDRLG